MKNFTVNWFNTSGKPNFEEYLSELKNKKNLEFLEIGSYEGQATCWLAENFPQANITCIDTFEGGMEHNREQLNIDTLYDRFKSNIEPYKARIEIKRGVSGEMLKSCNKKYDFVYIDGSHQAPDVLEDMILSFRMLKQSGIMIMDDYSWDAYKDDETLNPRLAIDVFMQVFKNKFELIFKGYQVGIKKL